MHWLVGNSSHVWQVAAKGELRRSGVTHNDPLTQLRDAAGYP